VLSEFENMRYAELEARPSEALSIVANDRELVAQRLKIRGVLAHRWGGGNS
jgi:hypothetical protein